MTNETFVPTSVARRLVSRMQANHERRRISVFAGPPGIGKTTAIEVFRSRSPGSIAVVKVGRQNAREVLVVQHAIEAVRQIASSRSNHVPSSVWALKNAFYNAVCQWAGADSAPARKGTHDAETFKCLTIVFDEAQNLSREAIDALRYWNDPDRCYGPFPVALVFVGNSEFSLASDSSGTSVISSAVADRALYVQGFGYEEVTDEDLQLFIAARGVDDPQAIASIIRSFRTPRAIRSLRRVLDLIDDLKDMADGGPITQQTVREALQLA